MTTMEDFFLLWLWILPMSCGAVCTLLLQYFWRTLRASFTRSSKSEWPRVKPNLMDQIVDEKTICQKGTNQCADNVTFIFLSSTGKAHKSANCSGKNPKKFWCAPSVSNEVLLLATVEKKTASQKLFSSLRISC